MANFEMDKNLDIAWCPGCGNFNIRTALIETLQELELEPNKVVISSGIGQAAKMPQYVNTNYFNGLHGRGLPAAVAIKASNPELTVIAEGGDGDMYGEGGNHFIHNVRRNPNITHLVHDNRVYGLTKGQAAPTTSKGFITPVQVSGVVNEPFNPLTVALSLGATFVARAFSGDVKQLKEILKAAINHKGYALVDIFHPCVTFNKLNNFMWYKDHCYSLADDYNPADLKAAFDIAFNTDKYALGVIYQVEGYPTFEDQLDAYRDDNTPIINRKRDISKVQELI